MQLGVTTVNICLVDLSDAVAEAARRLSGGGGGSWAMVKCAHVGQITIYII